MKDWCDAQLSRVTMYRLVTICLSVLLGVSGVLALSGYFAFSVGELVLSAMLLMGSVFGVSKLLGKVFGVAMHGESSVITGLILTFVLFPPAEWKGFIALILVGVIAAASKFLLAVRGRHVANPAAVAAVLAGVLGLASAGWWVATPALLPVVAATTCLILYKTRQLLVGGVFIALALTLVTLQGVVNGELLGESFWLALASWPIVFLAGVMLSEPLTQAPRRTGQLAVAALVAVLLVVPLHTPLVSMTPALALVMGNLVAWWLGSRRALSLKFVERRQLTPTSYEFVFQAALPFLPGQYIELMLPHARPDMRGMRRMFTIAASPSDGQVRFGIKIPEHHSTFKQTLANLQPGTMVRATRIAGDFVLPEDTGKPILFVAGGIGITPLISYLRARSPHDITLIYAVSSPAEIAYRDVLAVSGIRVIVVVPGGKAEVPSGWTVVDGVAVTKEILADYATDVSRQRVYISGPPLMVNSVKRLARSLGAKKVHTDHFSGY